MNTPNNSESVLAAWEVADDSDVQGPSCMWYPCGNVKIVSHARHDKQSGIGAWASVLCWNDCTELQIGLTNKKTAPTLIGALRAFQSLWGVDKVEFCSSSKKLITTMKTERNLSRTDWPASLGIWKALYGYAARYHAKWDRINHFRHCDLLLPDSPLFKAYVEFLNGRKRANQELVNCGLA